jgi:EthD domain
MYIFITIGQTIQLGFVWDETQGDEKMVKAILGYDIVPGMSVEAYEKWLREVHLPDLARIPGLRRVVFNTIKGTVRGNTTFYRIAELHYDDMDAFQRARQWREANPVSKERSPDGKTDFRFYVVCESEEVEFG